MLNILRSLLDIIVNLVSFVINTITSLINFIIQIPNYVNVLTASIGYMPTLLIPFALDQYLFEINLKMTEMIHRKMPGAWGVPSRGMKIITKQKIYTKKQ